MRGGRNLERYDGGQNHGNNYDRSANPNFKTLKCKFFEQRKYNTFN